MSDRLDTIRSKLAEMGAQFNPDVLSATRSLYAGLLPPPSAGIRADFDISYGPESRQKLDLYRSEASERRPVVLFVPGGGFNGGDKRMDEVFYGNVARWFVEQGFVAIAMNYRLAPDDIWPAGARDVGLALDWITSNVSRHGGDPGKIFVFGQSAGATHVATFLFHPELNTPVPGLAGAILASGLYRITEAHRAPNVVAYFGSDASKLADRSPITHVANSSIPLLLAVAEWDPSFLAAPTFQLADAITQRDGKAPPVIWLKGHNHVSPVLGFGSGDDVFGNRILEFIEDVSVRRF
jgi:acetyl esterase/lipase